MANVQTLNANDSLDGGGGTDTLTATIGTSVTPASLANIEVINVSNAAAANLTLTNANAVTTIKTGGNTNAITFDGLTTKLTGGLEITNNAQNVTVTSVATALAGTADELTIKVQSVTAGTVSIDPASGSNGYETITINSTGSVANTIAALNDGASTTFATLKVIGDKDLKITTALDAEVKTVSAVGFTGKLDLTLTNAAVHTITGGSGNDTFDFGGTFVGAENTTVANRDTVNGGDGTDTLTLLSAQAVAASAATQSTVSNIEVIKIFDATAGSVDITKFSGANTLSFGNATVGAHTFTLSNGNTVEFVTGAAGNSARTFAISGVGTTDALTFKAVAATDLGNAAQTISGVETLNIQTGASAGTAVIVGGALTMSPSAGGAAKIVVTGVNQLTLTGQVTANEIDAGGMTGNALLSMGTAAASAIKITGTGKNDAIFGSSGNDVLIAGLGADTITGGAGNDTIDLTETTASVDKVVFASLADDSQATSAVVTAVGQKTISGFGATDTLMIGGLGDSSTTATGLATISAAAAQGALTDDIVVILNASGAAGSLTTGSSTVLTAADFTASTLTNVAAFLSERFTTTNDANQENVIVWNVGTTSYVYNISSAASGSAAIAAGEIALVGIVTQGAALTSANLVYS